MDQEQIFASIEAAKETTVSRKGGEEYYEALKRFGYFTAEMFAASVNTIYMDGTFNAIKLALKRAIAAEEDSFALKFEYDQSMDLDDNDLIIPEYEVCEDNPEEWSDECAYEVEEPSEFKIFTAVYNSSYEDIILEDEISKKSFLAGIAAFFLENLNPTKDINSWKVDPTSDTIIYISLT